MKKVKFIYKPKVTIYDKVSKYTAVEGEACSLGGIEINGEIALARVINSQDNKLLIPLHVFENYFATFQVNE